MYKIIENKLNKDKDEIETIKLECKNKEIVNE